jgi:tetratricopeptide (TPR) repeat protein
VGQAETILEMADVIARQGEMSLALKTYQRVLAMAERYGDRRLRAEALNGIAHLHYQQKELDAAAAELAEAASIAAELGNRWVFGTSRSEAARVASSQGRDTDAVKAAREAAETFAAIGQNDREAIARARLARALLAAGDLAASADALARAETLAARSYSLTTRAETILARACLDAARGESRNAIHPLEAATLDARRRGALPLELESRLLQGEIEMAGHGVAQGRARLRDLARAARAKGYERIASEAEQARAARRQAVH